MICCLFHYLYLNLITNLNKYFNQLINQSITQSINQSPSQSIRWTDGGLSPLPVDGRRTEGMDRGLSPDDVFETFDKNALTCIGLPIKCHLESGFHRHSDGIDKRLTVAQSITEKMTLLGGDAPPAQCDT